MAYSKARWELAKTLLLKSYQILTASHRILLRLPLDSIIGISRSRHESRSYRYLSAHQLSSCQLQSSCYYLVLRQPRPVGDTRQNAAGTSVDVQQDRRFRVSSRLSRLRFRGSSSVSSRPTARRNAKGAVCVGAVSSVARQRDHILDVALRGCAAALFRVRLPCKSKQIRRTQQRKHTRRKNNS